MIKKKCINDSTNIVFIGSQRYMEYTNKIIDKLNQYAERNSTSRFPSNVINFIKPQFIDIDLDGRGDEDTKNTIYNALLNTSFNNIKGADLVVLINIDNYIGTSTLLEIGYAVANNKPILALQRPMFKYKDSVGQLISYTLYNDKEINTGNINIRTCADDLLEWLVSIYLDI